MNLLLYLTLLGKVNRCLAAIWITDTIIDSQVIITHNHFIGLECVITIFVVAALITVEALQSIISCGCLKFLILEHTLTHSIVRITSTPNSCNTRGILSSHGGIKLIMCNIKCFRHNSMNIRQVPFDPLMVPKLLLNIAELQRLVQV
jgi:hypothetical protein